MEIHQEKRDEKLRHATLSEYQRSVFCMWEAVARCTEAGAAAEEGGRGYRLKGFGCEARTS